MADGASDIARFIDSLPPQVNPYAALSEFVRSAIELPHGPTVTIHLYVNAGFLTLCLLLCVSVFIGKLRQGSLWFFKRQETRKGTIIIPHGQVFYVVHAACFCVTGGPAIWAILTGRKEAGALYNLPFLFLQYALWSEANYFYAMSYWHYNATHRQQQRIPAIYKVSAKLANLFFILGWPILVAAILPPSALSAKIYYELFSIMLRLEADLGVPESAWTEGHGFVWKPEFITHLNGIGDRTDPLRFNCSMQYIFFLATTMITVVAYLANFFYYRKVVASQIATDSAKILAGGQFSRQQVQALGQAHRFLGAQALSVLLGGLSFIGIEIYVICRMDEVLSDHHIFAIVVSLIYYWFNLFCGPVLVISCYGAWHDCFDFSRSNLKSTSTPALAHLLGVKITQEVSRSTDEHNLKDIDNVLNMVPLGLDTKHEKGMQVAAVHYYSDDV